MEWKGVVRGRRDEGGKLIGVENLGVIEIEWA
jgi:hypothetical protein